MQSLYAQTIGYNAILSVLLLYQADSVDCIAFMRTQLFKPPYRVYLSLGELKRLKDLVVDAKEKEIKVVPILVKRMLERNMFLLGFVDINEACVAEKISTLTDVQNARVQIACENCWWSGQYPKHRAHIKRTAIRWRCDKYLF